MYKNIWSKVIFAAACAAFLTGCSQLNSDVKTLSRNEIIEQTCQNTQAGILANSISENSLEIYNIDQNDETYTFKTLGNDGSASISMTSYQTSNEANQGYIDAILDSSDNGYYSTDVNDMGQVRKTVLFSVSDDDYDIVELDTRNQVLYEANGISAAIFENVQNALDCSTRQ